MDFNAKNFRYTTMAFGEFAKKVQSGKPLYLRALSADDPVHRPASLEQDFPTLASEFTLPKELKTCSANLHSSILRISGPVNMWLHYGMGASPVSTNSIHELSLIRTYRRASQCLLSNQRV